MPTPTGRHRRPPLRRRRRRALTVGMACVLAGGGVVLLADPVSAATEILCHPAGQQMQCTTSDPSKPYQFTVPAGLTSAQLDLRGGEGGHGGVEEADEPDRTFVAAQGGLAGGGGGVTSVVRTLTPGAVLQIYVGGPGGNANFCTAGGGGESGGIRTGGNGGGCDEGGTAAGGGGGGGTFVLTEGTPTTGTPLAVAGGGGGGAGSDGDESATGGRGGGNASGLAQPGNPFGPSEPGGKSGDQQPNLPGVGTDGAGAGCGGYRSSSVDSTPDCDYGGGGGGGGHFAGHGGGQAGGGGGGSGFPAAPASIQRSAAAFHAAQLGGSFTITFIPPPVTTRNHGGGPSSNDPNPNTNPAQVSPGDVSRTTTASCEPRVGVCHVGPIVGPDSVFNVTARGGTTHADLFGTLQGGSKPDCPNYTEMNGDWLAFGFQDPVAGASWRKLSTLTTRHKLSRPAAVALSRKMQICFEAPYRFLTRDGYQLGGHNAVFDGVLPDCAALGGRSDRGVTRPCVASRQVLSRHGGWVVRIAFRVPANSRDPKALG